MVFKYRNRWKWNRWNIWENGGFAIYTTSTLTYFDCEAIFTGENGGNGGNGGDESPAINTDFNLGAYGSDGILSTKGLGGTGGHRGCSNYECIGTYVHGIATMIATNYYDWSEDLASQTLTDMY